MEIKAWAVVVGEGKDARIDFGGIARKLDIFRTKADARWAQRHCCDPNSRVARVTVEEVE